MDMLVKLYDLPNSRVAFERLLRSGMIMRRALPPEKHKVIAWVRKTFSEGMGQRSRGRVQPPTRLLLHRSQRGQNRRICLPWRHLSERLRSHRHRTKGTKKRNWDSPAVRLSRRYEAARFRLRHHRRSWASSLLFKGGWRSGHRGLRARHLSRPALALHPRSWRLLSPTLLATRLNQPIPNACASMPSVQLSGQISGLIRRPSMLALTCGDRP